MLPQQPSQEVTVFLSIPLPTKLQGQEVAEAAVPAPSALPAGLSHSAHASESPRSCRAQAPPLAGCTVTHRLHPHATRMNTRPPFHSHSVIRQQKCTLHKHNVASQVLHNFSHEPFFHCISVIQIHGQLLESVNRNLYPCQNSKFIHSTFQHPTPSFLFISFSISVVKNSSPSLNLLTY